MMVTILQVIQEISNSYIGFYRNWKSFKDGFRDIQIDFYLGEEEGLGTEKNSSLFF